MSTSVLLMMIFFVYSGYLALIFYTKVVAVTALTSSPKLLLRLGCRYLCGLS